MSTRIWERCSRFTIPNCRTCCGARAPIYCRSVREHRGEKPSADSMNPNLGIFSLRGFSTHVSLCCGYELEDLLCSSIPGTKLYAPRLKPSIQTGLKIKSRFVQTGSFGGVFDNVLAVEQMDEHEVLLAVIGTVRELAFLGSVKDWRRKSRYAICRLDEFWVRDFAQFRRFFPVLEQFDLIFCSEYYSAEGLREELQHPEVIYLPPGVDTLEFAPVAEPSRRPIDVTNLGAIGEVTHEGLLEYSKEAEGFYFFDTLKGPFDASSPAEHRFRYANILKRSKYFLCYFAKMRSAELPEQPELGPRYIEGLAAGCVLMGSWKSTPAFDMYFGWEDAVIDLPFESTNAPEILRSLDRQADRLREISTRNVKRALESYDHAHRWRTIVNRLGLSQEYHMTQRQEALVRKLDEFEYPTRESPSL